MELVPGTEELDLHDYDPFAVLPDEDGVASSGSGCGHTATVHENGPDLEGIWDVHDSITGDALPTPLVRAAHAEEIKFMQDWEVGELQPISLARQRSGKGPLRGKWVNVNKGDSSNPNIRSRYVACEVRTYRDESLFASTPPLEALRLLLSWLATTSGSGHGHGGTQRLDKKA